MLRQRLSASANNGDSAALITFRLRRQALDGRVGDSPTYKQTPIVYYGPDRY